MKNPAKVKSRNLSAYQILLVQVKRALIEGQERVERERVRVYWETGRLIHTHILKNQGRAEYGAEVIARLSKDMDVDESLLNRCVKFAQVYPHLPIPARGQEFNWSHYRKLITIPDSKKRLRLEEKAGRNHWSAKELAARMMEEKPVIAKLVTEQPANLKSTPDHRLLTPSRGEFYTYQLIERPSLKAAQSSGLRIDLGFGVFFKVDPALLSRFSKGDIVETKPKDDIYKFYKSNRSVKDLYTYWAQVERVIDGDTVKVRFDLGFNVEARETLRLRGIDCPEIDTKEGQAAKTFVQAHLKEEDFIIVRTSRSDKYDRYLADVFIPISNSREDKNAPRASKKASRGHFNEGEESDSKTDIYLNNLLLEKGFAVRMD